jgi:hypothetical protein
VDVLFREIEKGATFIEDEDNAALAVEASKYFRMRIRLEAAKRDFSKAQLLDFAQSVMKAESMPNYSQPNFPMYDALPGYADGMKESFARLKTALKSF